MSVTELTDNEICERLLLYYIHTPVLTFPILDVPLERTTPMKLPERLKKYEMVLNLLFRSRNPEAHDVEYSLMTAPRPEMGDGNQPWIFLRISKRIEKVPQTQVVHQKKSETFTVGTLIADIWDCLGCRPSANYPAPY